jgi:hypothetical protein
MSQPPRVIDVEARYSIEELLGPLGWERGSCVEPAFMEQIVSESERCRQVMQGRAIYTRMDVSRVDQNVIEVGGKAFEEGVLASALDGVRRFALGICTVGDGIEEIIDEHFRGGDFFRGMVADVVGSRAVEHVAEVCASLICSEANESGLYPSGHLSPGYGEWDVSGQRVVFALLDPSPIGVSLNEHCMMKPKKSISFVVPLAEGLAHHADQADHHLCRECGLQDCMYRRE